MTLGRNISEELDADENQFLSFVKEIKRSFCLITLNDKDDMERTFFPLETRKRGSKRNFEPRTSLRL